MCAHAMQVAADTQVDELISQLSHLTQPEATDGQADGDSQTENLIAQVQSMLSCVAPLGRQLHPVNSTARSISARGSQLVGTCCLACNVPSELLILV